MMNGILCCDYLTVPPTYEEFLHSYLLPNRPVVIGSSLVSSWLASEKWVLPRDTSSASAPQIDWDYLSAMYGQQEVIVADCSTHEFSDQKRQTMLFREVVTLWKKGEGRSLYVKDWHLVRVLFSQPESSRPEPFYSTPDILRDDWMNAYYSACTKDDFRFVYAGAAGTFTPLHRDVYTSYSWSTNVCGRKRWWLFPPNQTRCLLRKGREEHMETVFDVRDVDPNEFPEFVHARPVVIEQKDGETIFVPSGWYHQVENLTACISINHNWCNAVNLPSLYQSMYSKVVEVEHALEDVRELLSQTQNDRGDGGWESEWVEIVQDVVEKDAGWNWMTFWNMVLYALRSSMDASGSSQPGQGLQSAASAPLWEFAPSHLTPSWDFVRESVLKCYDDFIKRGRGELRLVKGLNEVLRAVGAYLTD